ncbi:MAG: tRNA (uracil-5-)-methyltransferase [Ruminiclostridium sp.]|nr:tRNA (uracil-5-)-methyltransferase [Ruminiclostridium sp.]
MNRKLNIILAAFLALITAVTMLGGCSSEPTGDTVERFAAAAPSDSGSIDIPGYESLSFKAGNTAQSVNLKNPQTNDCYFVLSLITDGETLWTSDYIEPGYAVKNLTLTRALEKGEYDAVLHYDCFTLNDKTPLNGAEIQLKINVK